MTWFRDYDKETVNYSRTDSTTEIIGCELLIFTLINFPASGLACLRSRCTPVLAQELILPLRARVLSQEICRLKESMLRTLTQPLILIGLQALPYSRGELRSEEGYRSCN
jgi:hypothetical protein